VDAPSGRRLTPWWLRWPGWWEQQQAQVRHRWGPGDGFVLHDATHEAAWVGRIPNPTAPEGAPVAAVIQWGPATPFFAPRVFFPECMSAVHQLQDGSLCLLPPIDPENGWEGPLDVSFWMERAEDWLCRFNEESWALPPAVWALTRPLQPAYRYRQVLAETRVIALPPSWADPKPGCGRVAIALPKGPGLGAVVGWDDGRGATERWDAGRRLVRDPAEVIEGIWARFAPANAATPHSFRTPSFQHRFERLLRDGWKGAAEAGADRVTLFSVPLDFGHGPSKGWLYRRHAPPGILEGGAPLERLLALAGFPTDTGTGIALHPEALDARRKAGRSDKMHEAIGKTQVVIAGLGSLGSEIAHLLAQEGVRAFYLVDGDLLMPGNEARHRAGLADSGRAKVSVVADLIRQVQPEASILTHQGWVDELAPTLQKSTKDWSALIVGATGDEATEHFLGDMARGLDVPCVHAWLELDGKVLRAARYLPGLDPTISAAANLEATPRLERPSDATGPRICADTVLPGSALSIHAAANFVVRVVLDVIAGAWSNENHWLFAPGGLDLTGGPAELKRPYGVLGVELPAP